MTTSVARAIAVLGASVVVVHPPSVAPPPLSPLPAAAVCTVGYDTILTTASFPYFLSQVFVSDPPEDYIATALSGFRSAISSTLSKINDAIKKAVSGGSSTTGPSTGDAETP